MKPSFLFVFLFKLKTFFSNHKIIGTLIIIMAIILGYYSYNYFFGTSSETKYTISKIEKSTLISSVSGTGQVSAYDQVDVKSKASGDIVWIDLKVGQSVSSRQALAGIDNTDAKKAVADAGLDLQETKLNFDKDVAQAPIDYERKLESLKSSQDDLVKIYEDSFNTISNAFLELPGIITGIQNILYGYDLEPQIKGWNVDAYRNMFARENKDLITSLSDIAERDYKMARTAYDKNFDDFKNITRYSSDADIEKMLEQTLDTTKLIAQASKSENNLLDTIIDLNDKAGTKINPIITTLKTNLKGYLGTINNQLSSLLSQKSSLSDIKQTIINTERDIQIMQVNNPTGINPINLQISENTINKKEVALADLKTKLADYTVRAPFAGIIAKVNIKNGDTISAGTAIVTLITKQKIASITLNEVDVSKIKIGQKVTIVFDAIEGLSIAGEVSEIDTLGTVSQGVVSYNVQINFDTQDDRVKAGMSISASIITDVKPDILVVPSSAIKTQGGESYVELFEGGILPDDATINGQIITSPTAPTKRTVTVGDSNDTQTEIISGLKEGEEVVVRTTTSTVKTTTSSSLFRLPGAGGGARQGGNVGGAIRLD